MDTKGNIRILDNNTLRIIGHNLIAKDGGILTVFPRLHVDRRRPVVNTTLSLHLEDAHLPNLTNTKNIHDKTTDIVRRLQLIGERDNAERVEGSGLSGNSRHGGHLS
jgi:hypothetical protein